MRWNAGRAKLLAVVMMTFGLIATACGSDDTVDLGSGATSAEASLSGTLKGSGASFPDKFYQAAIQAFGQAQPNLTITYEAKGSGGGQTDLQGQLVDFAGSDDPVKDEDFDKFAGEFLYFPTVAAPITVAYNLPGVSELKLSGATLGGIFGGSITTWNDAAIAADNPGVTLPETKVTIVHRSDSSGTTANFTKFLAAAGGRGWTLGSGKTIAWPNGSTGAEKNSGVANAIKAASGAIGYVDFADAKASGLTFAAIQNKEGEFVEPSLEATSLALAGAAVESNLLYNPVNANGKGVYPIAAPTWILVYKQQPDQKAVDNLKGWLEFLLTTGQESAETVDFAPLPERLLTKARAQLDDIVVTGASSTTTTVG